MPEDTITITLHKGKETKNGYIRYEEGSEGHAKNIYLSPDDVKKLGSPESITVTIEATK